MTFHRPAISFLVAPSAKSVGVPLIKSGHGMRFGRCFGLVAGEAGFCLHYGLMQAMIEANIALG